MSRAHRTLLVVVDSRHSLLVSGSGDVIQPTDGILCAGSGGAYALAAARALIAHTDLSAGEIEALRIMRGPFTMFRRGEPLALMPFTVLR